MNDNLNSSKSSVIDGISTEISQTSKSIESNVIEGIPVEITESMSNTDSVSSIVSSDISNKLMDLGYLKLKLNNSLFDKSTIPSEFKVDGF